MRKSALLLAGTLFALAGCGEVSVSSNDARTQEMINDVQEGASDLVNGAGNVAADAGNEIGEAARSLGNSVDSIGDGNVTVDANKAD